MEKEGQTAISRLEVKLYRIITDLDGERTGRKNEHARQEVNDLYIEKISQKLDALEDRLKKDEEAAQRRGIALIQS